MEYSKEPHDPPTKEELDGYDAWLAEHGLLLSEDIRKMYEQEVSRARDLLARCPNYFSLNMPERRWRDDRLVWDWYSGSYISKENKDWR